MKKRALCLLLAAVLSVSLLPLTARAAGSVAIDETNFPDAIFRQYVADNFDTNSDGSLSETEIAAVDSISIYYNNALANMKGIGFFPEISALYCFGNSHLTKLDLSKNTKLTYIDCGGNNLTKLNLGNNAALRQLLCYNNQLTSLDVSRNTSLTQLNCDSNQLKTLNISKNPNLKYLICYGNLINKLDISACQYLMRAFLRGTKEENTSYYRYYLDSTNELWVDPATEVTGYLPAITTQPASKTVAAGKSVTFSVKATGAELQYQWQVKKSSSADWTDLSGKTSAKLTLTMKKSMDEYKYRCIVSNEAGKATSSAAKLTLMVKPRITTQPRSAKVKAGNNVTFKVKATGGALKYQWYWAKPGSNVWTKVSGGTKASLKISAKKSLTGRRYRCQVKNAVGTVYTKAVTLSVY